MSSDMPNFMYLVWFLTRKILDWLKSYQSEQLLVPKYERFFKCTNVSKALRICGIQNIDILREYMFYSWIFHDKNKLSPKYTPLNYFEPIV